MINMINGVSIFIVCLIFSPLLIIESFFSGRIIDLLYALNIFFGLYGNILSILCYVIAKIFKLNRLKKYSKYCLYFSVINLILMLIINYNLYTH